MPTQRKPEALKPEFSVEINSHDAHMIIRVADRARADRAIRALFPDAKTEILRSEMIVGGTKEEVKTEFIFTGSYEKGEKPVGTISNYVVPSDWLTNRRLEDEDQVAA